MQTSHTSSTSDSTTRVLETTPSPSSPPSTTTGGLPACASCRHQRKKCTQKCILAPFFPAEKTREFQAVHRVFGVSNVTKMVKGLSTEDAIKAVDSLVWEANCRLSDPVLGPLAEFQRVCEELKFYKTQHQLANMHYHLNNNNSNNNNIRQFPVMQDMVLYNNKGTQQRVIGSWNGENNNTDGNNNNNVTNGFMLDYMQNSGMFKYLESLQNMERSLKQQRDQQEEGSAVHPQQQMMNDFGRF
ncbi:uncharacterized protein LOC143534756 [Bidens hawaiensis]|uniref:uncharacterized protein LOC143534756 n=1 Tax=Bidens hawaiensis TaxID=980011 RepID=UPI00404A97E8